MAVDRHSKELRCIQLKPSMYALINKLLSHGLGTDSPSPGIPPRDSLPVFSPLSIASVFGNSVVIVVVLLVFNETGLFAILHCRASCCSGIAVLPDRFHGGLCFPLHHKTTGNRNSVLHLSKPPSSPLGRTQKEQNGALLETLASKTHSQLKHSSGTQDYKCFRDATAVPLDLSLAIMPALGC